jgi:hypothetical protein
VREVLDIRRQRVDLKRSSQLDTVIVTIVTQHTFNLMHMKKLICVQALLTTSKLKKNRIQRVVGR